MPRTRSHVFATLVLMAALTGCGDTPLQPTFHTPTEIRRTLGPVAPSLFTQVDAGDLGHACGVRGDGTISCWGSNSWGQSSPPAGTFLEVSAAEVHTCAVRTNGTLACWGYNGDGRGSAPAGTFTHVSAARAHTCAIRSTGTVVCWGENSQGEASPPAGTFTQISAASYHTCGVRTDGTVACWGRNLAGNAAPPAGTFTQVAAAYQNTCGVRTDGTVACWGYNGNGQATPPAGTFIAVGTGSVHSCGVRTDGTLACWGYDGDGESSPPAGATFIAISSGYFRNCALTSGGSVACWGASTTGQFAPPPHVPQAIAFTSTPPRPAILGATYQVTASGGESGNPVTFTSLTPSVCTLVSTGSANIVSLDAIGACTIAADQAGDALYLPASQATQSFDVVFSFSGFFAPVDDPGPNEDVVNRAKAGAGIAVKFALGGDQGLAIFKPGYPRFVSTPCSADDTDELIDDASASPAGLQYDPSTAQYTYVWKSNKAWAGACGSFGLGLVDGTSHRALFHFVR
jgi:hypothetical protein